MIASATITTRANRATAYASMAARSMAGHVAVSVSTLGRLVSTARRRIAGGATGVHGADATKPAAIPGSDTDGARRWGRPRAGEMIASATTTTRANRATASATMAARSMAEHVAVPVITTGRVVKSACAARYTACGADGSSGARATKPAAVLGCRPESAQRRWRLRAGEMSASANTRKPNRATASAIMAARCLAVHVTVPVNTTDRTVSTLSRKKVRFMQVWICNLCVCSM